MTDLLVAAKTDAIVLDGNHRQLPSIHPSDTPAERRARGLPLTEFGKVFENPPANRSRTVMVLSAKNGTTTSLQHDAPVMAVAMSPSGRSIAVAVGETSENSEGRSQVVVWEAGDAAAPQ